MDTHRTPEKRLAEASVADYEIVSTDRSTVTLGRTAYTVETINFSGGTSETHLIGPEAGATCCAPSSGRTPACAR